MTTLRETMNVRISDTTKRELAERAGKLQRTPAYLARVYIEEGLARDRSDDSHSRRV